MTHAQHLPIDTLETPQAAAAFDLRPLLVANLTCTMAMMAFVSLIGPSRGFLAWPPGRRAWR